MKNTPECDLFVERLNRVLDGELTPSSLVGDAHLTVCATCQLRHAAAGQIAAYRPKPPAVPAGFADLVVARTQTVERQEKWWRWEWRILGGAGAAIAASLLFAVWMNATAPRTDPNIQPLVVATPPTGVVKPLNDARDAIVSLSTTVASDTVAPVTSLYEATTKAKPPVAVAEAGPLSDFPDAAKAGIEPLVNTPRRALNLFLRDVGGIAGSRKDKS